MNYYKAEVWDKVQKNFETFNDHCLHGINQYCTDEDAPKIEKMLLSYQTQLESTLTD